MRTRSRYSNRERRPTVRPQLESLEERTLLVAGFLDPAFGHFGDVTTNFYGGRGALSDDFAKAVAIQPDGKIVVAGFSERESVEDSRDFAVARYNPNGSLDTSFGFDGKINTDFDPFGESNDMANALAVQPDGKIVVAGTTAAFSGSGGPNFAVARYLPDGSLDSSFGGGFFLFPGTVVTDFGGFDSGNGVVIQPDGKIIVIGSGDNGSNPSNPSDPSDFAVARYNADGSLDDSFDGDGRVLTHFAGSSYDSANSVGIQPDGKLVLGGLAVNEFAIARYNPDGSLDADLDGDGRATSDLDAGIQSHSLALQPDGKMVLAGSIDGEPALVRFNPDGTVDKSFGGDGVVTTDCRDVARFQAVAVQPDGKIIAAGGLNFSPSPVADFCVMRFLKNGNLDTTFSFDGRVFTEFNLDATDNANAIAIQPDGKIVVAGWTRASPDSDFDFAIARYFGDVEPTKFFVVDSAAKNTFQYDAQGDLVQAIDLSPAIGQPRGITSNATGSRVWVLDQTGKVYVYNPNGFLFGSWTALGPTSASQLEGIAVNDTGIYIVDAALDAVWVYPGGQDFVSGSHPGVKVTLALGNMNPKGITADNDEMWIVDNGQALDKVYKYTAAPAIGALLGSWVIDPANASPTGITINPANVDHLWIVDNVAKQVFQYNHATGRTTGSQPAVGIYNLHPGNTNPQDIADPSLFTAELESASLLPGPVSPNPAARGDAAAPEIVNWELVSAATTGRGRRARITSIVLTASEALDPDLATEPSHYQIMLVGARRNRPLDVRSVSYDEETNQITLLLRRGIHRGKSLEVTVAGQVRDLSGNPLNWTARLSGGAVANSHASRYRQDGNISFIAIDSLLDARLRTTDLLADRFD